MFPAWLSHLAVRPDPPVLEVFGIGAAVLVTITLVHGSVLGFIVRDYHRGAKRMLRKANHPFWASLQFGRTVLLMLLLHILDMAIWAVMLSRLGLVPDLRNSFYFTANSYTTLGYGIVPLGYGWRELSPIMAICGLFTFAWTTSVMFNVVGYQRQLAEELAEEFGRKKQLHRNLLAELNALRVEEAGQERAAIAAERKEEASKSLLQRCRMRWAQRKELYAIRRTAMEQAAAALAREREAKSKIYQPPPSQTPPA
jgi:Ion channel